MTPMSSDLADLLGTQETASLEFKQTARDRDKIGQAICALANDLPGRGGGDLLIGVAKDGTPCDETDVSDRTLLAITDYRDDGRILDRPSMTVEAGNYRGSPVIRIHVEASSTPRCVSKASSGSDPDPRPAAPRETTSGC